MTVWEGQRKILFMEINMEFIKKFNRFMYSDMYSPFEVLAYLFIGAFKLGFVPTVMLVLGVMFFNRVMYNKTVAKI